jgi:hypothetical protein
MKCVSALGERTNAAKISTAGPETPLMHASPRTSAHLLLLLLLPLALLLMLVLLLALLPTYLSTCLLNDLLTRPK